MIYQVKIKIQSHVEHGNIIIGDQSLPLSKKIFEHEFNTTGSTEKILSIDGLSPGLDKAVEIEWCEIDGYVLPEPEIFFTFQMLGNPYVENVSIKEKVIAFNGDLEFKVDQDRLLYFPYHYSKNRIDFVYNNHFGKFQAPNPAGKIALGCSQTFGIGIDKTETWPALLGYDNYGVPAIGVDAIFCNAKRIIELYQPKSMIIMFPNMDRRLLQFQKGDYYFRIPVLINHLEDLFDQDYYWIKSDELKQKISSECNEIIKDEDNEHSKKFLQLISALPCDIHVSSWSNGTYEQLPKYFKNVLPSFEGVDKSSDGQHYGPLSHKKWAESIKNHNI